MQSLTHSLTQVIKTVIIYSFCQTVIQSGNLVVGRFGLGVGKWDDLSKKSLDGALNGIINENNNNNNKN